MKKKTIGLLVGSARTGSFCQKIAKELSGFLPPDFESTTPDLAGLPLFNQDYDEQGTTPSQWTTFRQQVEAMDGVLIITPEYNRSYPALLKNALDIASRPPGQNLWSGKPCGIVGVSPGKMGAFGAVHHLRQVVSFLNMYTMQQPEIYIADVANLLDQQGAVTSDDTRGFLSDCMGAYVQWANGFFSAS